MIFQPITSFDDLLMLFDIHQFFVNSVFLWNSIPFDVLSAPVNHFKYKLKQFLF